MNGTPIRALARQYGFSGRSLRRHTRWYGLDVGRVLPDLVAAAEREELAFDLTFQQFLRLLDFFQAIACGGLPVSRLELMMAPREHEEGP